MTPRKSTLLIIPALNEEKSIGPVILGVRQHFDCDILVIDGYSRDRTVVVARESGAMVVQLSKSLGIAGAIELGILYASREGYQYLARIDADGQHRPEDLNKLLAVLKDDKADFVIGSRFLGNSEYKPNLLRHSSIGVISLLLRMLYRIKITDCTSGCQLYNRQMIEFFAQDTSFEYSEVRAIWMAHKATFRVREEFINMAPRSAGVSSFSPMIAWLYMFKNIVDLLLSIPVPMRRYGKK